MGLTPVHFFSHGSTMMLGEESTSADYWKKCGDEALAHGIKGVIMMGAHWDARGDKIMVSANPKPNKSPVAYVHPSKYVDYELNPDLPTSDRVLDLLLKAGFNAEKDATFDWIHDTFLILIRMFPNGCPPTTIVSMNAYYDPHYHMKVGSTLRSLRKEGYLIVGTGGAVHNLYRNVWWPMVQHRDNFAQVAPPEKSLLEFRQAVEDVMTQNQGPALRRAMTRLMKHYHYRDAHGTDDHFMAACFCAGAAGDWEDLEEQGGVLGAETWELQNMCNSQFTIGNWQGSRSVRAAAVSVKRRLLYVLAHLWNPYNSILTKELNLWFWQFNLASKQSILQASIIRTSSLNDTDRAATLSTHCPCHRFATSSVWVRFVQLQQRVEKEVSGSEDACNKGHPGYPMRISLSRNANSIIPFLFLQPLWT
ncbi:LigB subunit of an aromatic-ring-opening dioxygenase LigAB, partial [Aureobasidium melanogenum]